MNSKIMNPSGAAVLSKFHNPLRLRWKIRYLYTAAILYRLRRWPLEFLARCFGLRSVTRRLELDGISFDFTLRMDDRGLSRDLLANDWREYHSTKYFLNTFVGENETVLDIGANIGYFAIIEALRSRRNTVYAVEPVSRTYELLCANLALNRLENAKPFRLAIGGACGSREILTCAYANWATLNPERLKFMQERCGPVGREVVDVLTLRDFALRYMDRPPTLLRMDVEGMEYEILVENRDFLRQYRPRIACEFHFGILGKARSIGLLECLAETGYEIDRCFTNFLYCHSDLAFGLPPQFVPERKTCFADLIAEVESKSDSEIAAAYGCELFCSPRS